MYLTCENLGYDCNDCDVVECKYHKDYCDKPTFDTWTKEMLGNMNQEVSDDKSRISKILITCRTER
jgi:hypothetical protein